MTKLSKTTIETLDYCISTLKMAQKLLEWERYKAAEGVELDDASEQTVLDAALDHDMTCAEVYEILAADSQEKRRSVLESQLYRDFEPDKDIRKTYD